MESSAPDYRKMYLTLLHAAEQATELLIAAQQACEEIYMETAPDAPAEE